MSGNRYGKVSVIVPVYNVEKYIDKSVGSLLEQTYRDMEIILINDGSTDGSLEKLNEFARKDERVIVLDQQNHGVAVARNYGLKTMSGDYLAFLDSDDWLELNAIEFLVERLQEEEADIALFHTSKEYANHSVPRVHTRDSGVTDYHGAMIQILLSVNENYQPTGSFLSIWNKFYRVRSLRNAPGGLKPFVEGVWILEDGLWLIQNRSAFQKCVLCPELLHHRLMRDDSAMGKKDQWLYRTEEYMRIYHCIIQELVQAGESEFVEVACDSYYGYWLAQLCVDRGCNEGENVMHLLNTIPEPERQRMLERLLKDLLAGHLSFAMRVGKKLVKIKRNNKVLNWMVDRLMHLRDMMKGRNRGVNAKQ